MSEDIKRVRAKAAKNKVVKGLGIAALAVASYFAGNEHGKDVGEKKANLDMVKSGVVSETALNKFIKDKDVTAIVNMLEGENLKHVADPGGEIEYDDNVLGYETFKNEAGERVQYFTQYDEDGNLINIAKSPFKKIDGHPYTDNTEQEVNEDRLSIIGEYGDPGFCEGNDVMKVMNRAGMLKKGNTSSKKVFNEVAKGQER